jgi:hypothetical protein
MSSALHFLTDEDFDNDIVRGMLGRLLNMDFVRVQDLGLSGALDSRLIILKFRYKDSSGP